MTNLQRRKDEVIGKIAAKAFWQPLLDSGLLFLDDIRDNFYYASYLFAASQEENEQVEWDREQGKRKAEEILFRVLELQDQHSDSSTYGHWPLKLRPTPREASKNTLPVELMGSLMVYFYERYANVLNESLRFSFEQALLHIYQSNFYRKPLEHFGHHEAKYTAAKLIFGQRYKDKELLEDGYQSLQNTLSRITSMGMSEYGSLPWFWHWVQAFTCAWELSENVEIKHTLAQMLDYLWAERSTFYLGGAFVGPHARIWPHDMPRDTNVLHDYVQFGDFKWLEEMPRTEYAGFFAYEASTEVKHKALTRAMPMEVKRRVPKAAALAAHKDDCLHSYVYITENYAMGGIWERSLEFDNEQHRWDIALPLDAVQGANHVYFFHPGSGYSEGDLRHQSEYSEVLFHENTIIASYQLPEDQPDTIIGCLPVGDWVEETSGLFGFCGNVYIAIHVQQPYQRVVLEDRSIVTSRGRSNAVVVACIDKNTANSLGIEDVHQFAKTAKQKQPSFTQVIEGDFRITYMNFKNEILVLGSGPDSEMSRLVNGKAVDFTTYTVT
ncbi:hypothetical protein [Paenibacillus sp. N3.4]|uniref:hypothetical protein n=1 Tax=Paenibacillus sp. N3.4 TaxID=2603222 RepID=UPI0021C3CB1F|nr:hypothetical protein [Paenibacillus sp. N3.4]